LNLSDLAVPLGGADRVPTNAYPITDGSTHRDLLVMSSTILTLDGRPLYVLGSAQLATTQTTWRVAAEGATGGGNEGMWAALCAQGSIVNTIP